MVEFFSGDWLPSHCLFSLSQNLLSSTVKVRGEKCRLDEIKFAKKNHFNIGKIQTFSQSK